MINFIIRAATIVIVISCTYLLAIAGPDDDYGDGAEHAQKMLDQLKLMDKPLAFYGMIIDQNSNPVANAVISTEIEDSNGVRDVLASTGLDGRFTISGETGNSILLQDITCNGYEYTRSDKVITSFKNGFYTQNINAPYIFKLRKKEAATLVLKDELKWLIDPSVPYYEVDLVKIDYGKPGSLAEDSERSRVDLVIKATKTDGKDSYSVTIIPKELSSGILSSSELLYVPPETGYGKTISLEIVAGGKYSTFIYVKGRNAGIYSRLEIKLNANVKGVTAFVSVFTNPNGLRNLDFDEDLYSQFLDQRFDEDRQRSIDWEQRKTILYRK